MVVHTGMRIFEIAVQSGVEHYVWGSLDYSLKRGKYNEMFRCGHYDGKGKVAGMLMRLNAHLETHSQRK
jgi:hypothetical protein